MNRSYEIRVSYDRPFEGRDERESAIGLAVQRDLERDGPPSTRRGELAEMGLRGTWKPQAGEGSYRLDTYDSGVGAWVQIEVSVVLERKPRRRAAPGQIRPWERGLGTATARKLDAAQVARLVMRETQAVIRNVLIEDTKRYAKTQAGSPWHQLKLSIYFDAHIDEVRERYVVLAREVMTADGDVQEMALRARSRKDIMEVVRRVVRSLRLQVGHVGLSVLETWEQHGRRWS